MGKSKNQKGKGAKSAAPRCACDHPFNCGCGNRPPRPSRGHKWYPETQEWAGKGHKQKGASGQTALLSKEAKITDTGKTKIEQWQRLPSQLLKEICKKQRRPPPKFKEIKERDNKLKVRVIVNDAKGDDKKDLILIPSQSVGNEEQAKEEAALLALLQLTPTLPHERKLPEPYKTTWLAAIQATKGNSSSFKPKSNSNTTTTNNNTTATATRTRGASSNTNLTVGNVFRSHADKRRMQVQARQKRNARMARHEAIRMANRNHSVFLSAALRKQIQSLLQGTFVEEEIYEEDLPELALPESDCQFYIEERLHQEGFTKHQARRAYNSLNSAKDSTEELWEGLYDECLQFLLIHLKEDQVPEGLDPRNATLEVITTTVKKKKAALSPLSQKFANDYGLLREDAVWLEAKATEQNNMQETFWNSLCTLANVNLELKTASYSDQEGNIQLFQDEMEAMEAIFPDSCSLTENNDNLQTLTLQTPEEMTMELVLEKGKYPSTLPHRLFIKGKWPSPDMGLAVHVALVQYMAEELLERVGEPMVFELFGQLQLLLSSPLEELPILSLSSSSSSDNKNIQPKHTQASASNEESVSTATNNNTKKKLPALPRRPRARGDFWSSSNTPPAISMPNISKALKQQRNSLPAYKAKGDFLQCMKQAEESNSRVVLVTGDTGCGKTTQIPQYILEASPEMAKIVVAQPRRLAATGVAARVAQERGEAISSRESVGYVVRGDSSYGNKTRLLFCTFGILLRQLQCQDSLKNVTHIVLDEVHERNLDCDVLMALLKSALVENPNLRVVLMSATLDSDRFAKYWGGAVVPRMHIPGRTFPVTDYLLEDVLEVTGYIPSKKGKKKSFPRRNFFKQNRKSTPWDDSELSNEEEDEDEEPEEASDPTVKRNTGNVGNVPPLEERVKRVDETRIDYDMLGVLIKHLIQNNTMGKDGSVLVFLPGAPEIHQAKTAVAKICSTINVLLLPLHGGLQPKEQALVFGTPKSGQTKIILSTNVAETSITIPDCTIVIDSCREKQSSYDPVNRMPLLKETFASKASLKQRRGRAGRVRAGTCYKLISRPTYDSLRDHTAPEITRCALDQTLLSLLFLGVERGNGSFLTKLLDPPSTESIDAAVYSLWKVGALKHKQEEEAYLTPLGMHLAGIPAPPVVGKILIMGSILGCRRAAMAMAAGISVGRSPFLKIDLRQHNHRQQQEESPQQAKQRLILKERATLFQLSGNSDHAMLATAFQQWENLKAGGGERKRFCENLGLSFTGMRDILQLVLQYDSSLKAAGYNPNKESDRNAHSFRILKTCAISSMAPSQLVKLVRPSTKYSDTAEGAVEKDGVAKEMKYFIRTNSETIVVPWKEQQKESTQDSAVKEERVFIHPSSSLFTNGNYSCPWLVYHSMVKTSKPFLRDATECSAYALLLFGGQLDVQARNDCILIDDWVKLAANARIGALVRGLRGRMDDLLEQKISNPKIDISDTPEMKLIVKLLITDGLGN